jgi:putative lipase involved disintegration of autophagic bodies
MTENETKTKQDSLTNQLLRDIFKEMKEVNAKLTMTAQMSIDNKENITKIIEIQDNCPILNFKKGFKYLGVKLSIFGIIAGSFGGFIIWLLKQFVE